MMKNKKGSLPIIIFVLGVFAVCAVAIISFVVSLSFTRVHSSDTNVFEDIYSTVEKIYFYRNINYGGFTEKEIEDLLDVEITGNVLKISREWGDLSVVYTKVLD